MRLIVDIVRSSMEIFYHNFTCRACAGCSASTQGLQQTPIQYTWHGSFSMLCVHLYVIVFLTIPFSTLAASSTI